MLMNTAFTTIIDTSVTVTTMTKSKQNIQTYMTLNCRHYITYNTHLQF